MHVKVFIFHLLWSVLDSIFFIVKTDVFVLLLSGMNVLNRKYKVLILLHVSSAQPRSDLVTANCTYKISCNESEVKMILK